MERKFWKPDTAAPGSGLSEERQPDVSGVSTFVYNPHVNLSVEQQRQKLPIFAHRNNILYLLEKYQCLVIVGETGCGKSTQVPQYLLEAGWAAGNRVIAVTQPRRVSAVTVVTRIADERGVTLGQEVGYTIRFEECFDASATRLRFMTDGMLVREMMHDPLLMRYSVVMVDEAHERSLNCDIALGLLKKIAKKRPELRIIISSATIDAEKFRDYFNINEFADASKATSTILTVQGRAYPVDVFYALDPVPNYLTATAETVMKIHKSEADGDVLVFLTGQDEVEHTVSLLVEEARKMKVGAKTKLMVMPMYASLPHSEQLKVFRRTPRDTRKIVVATNIAEASITIPGIVYVVDCGFMKIKAYNARSGVESLITVPTSKASAVQRAGRAGRVRSGKAYRLYREEEFAKLPDSAVPEMQRTAMAPTVLQLKALGIDSVLRFPFVSPPPAENFLRGVELLYALGAIDASCKLTSPIGERMAELPLEPSMAKSLLVSDEYGCSEEILTIAAMTQIQNVFSAPSNQKIAAEKARHKFAVEEGDHITMINVFEAFVKYGRNARWCRDHFINYRGMCRAVEIREQLLRYVKRFGVKLLSAEGRCEPVCRCLAAGLFANAAVLHHSGVYRTIREGHEMAIHPMSVLFASEPPPKCVVFNEVVMTTKDFMRDVTVVQSEWLYTLAPHYYEFGSQREIAAKRSRVE